jgi:hypothetical protein
MRWLGLTILLLAASVALVVGIYLRDRQTSDWLPPPRNAANSDVKTMLLQTRCGGQCTYKLVGNPRPDHWIARVDNGTAIQCFDINLLAFDTSDSHGVSGVAAVPCDSVGITAPG